MFGKVRKPHEDYKVFVEVLQNGELLSELAKPFNRPCTIRLTSDPDGDLSAPFYPLPTDIDLIKITKRGAEVDLDPNWEGFTTFEGRIEDINSHRKTQYTHIMKQGDYGSIAYNDLRILIRIGKDRPKSSDTKGITGEYRGHFFKFWFENTLEVKTLAIGVLAATWVFAGIVVGLMKRPDSRPKQLADLKPVYTLPFIYPKHLALLPEAMQQNLNRKNLVSSVFSFYNSFTTTVLGMRSNPPPEVFQSTFETYHSIYRDQRIKIRQIEDEQKTIELKFAGDNLRSLIYIPAVKGDTLPQQLLRLKDKINIAHLNFEQNLSLRKKVSEEFHRDTKYIFDQYQAVNRFDQPKKYESWKMTKDESAMYGEALEMGQFAAMQQMAMKRQREKIVEITEGNSRPITIDPSNTRISFINPKRLENLSKKIAYIQASTFDLRKAGMVREPLQGDINPDLISKTINHNRFDLQLCFELALRRNQSTSGTMEWQWRLDSRGKISDIELVDSSIKDRRMIRCVRKKIASWKFPRPNKGSVEIRYPFNFNPAKG